MVSEEYESVTREVNYSLNPCFSGGWSRSSSKKTLSKKTSKVLILVLVEDGLGATTIINNIAIIDCLNPCFSGGWSRRLYFI